MADRLRTALVQAADLSTELQEMKQQMDKSVGSFALTEEKLVSQIADLNRAIASIKDDDALMRAKLAIAEKVPVLLVVLLVSACQKCFVPSRKGCSCSCCGSISSSGCGSNGGSW